HGWSRRSTTPNKAIDVVQNEMVQNFLHVAQDERGSHEKLRKEKSKRRRSWRRRSWWRRRAEELRRRTPTVLQTNCCVCCSAEGFRLFVQRFRAPSIGGMHYTVIARYSLYAVFVPWITARLIHSGVLTIIPCDMRRLGVQGLIFFQLGEPPILYDAHRRLSYPLFQSRLLRGHTLLASPPELDIFFRTRCLVPSCECGSRFFCRRWQVPNLLCRLHLVSVVLASALPCESP
ncbi:unnamed protein product, partial [Trichogramma brassicae]